MTKHISLEDMTARWPALLKDEAAATYCGRSLSAYRRLRDKGAAPPQVIWDGAKLTRRSDLDAFIASLPTAGEMVEEDERSAADEAFR